MGFISAILTTPAERREYAEDINKLRKWRAVLAHNQAVLFTKAAAERYIIFSYDTKNEGIYRLTWFDKHGAITHIARDTIKEIIKELRRSVKEGYEIAETM